MYSTRTVLVRYIGAIQTWCDDVILIGHILVHLYHEYILYLCCKAIRQSITLYCKVTVNTSTLLVLYGTSTLEYKYSYCTSSRAYGTSTGIVRVDYVVLVHYLYSVYLYSTCTGTGYQHCTFSPVRALLHWITQKIK